MALENFLGDNRYSSEEIAELNYYVERIIPALAQKRFTEVESALREAMGKNLDIPLITRVFQQVRTLRQKKDETAKLADLSEFSSIVQSIKKQA